MVAVIDSFETFKTVTGGDKLVIIDFWATWSVYPLLPFLFLSTLASREPFADSPRLPTLCRCGPW
jgi:hypothetical protein